MNTPETLQIKVTFSVHITKSLSFKKNGGSTFLIHTLTGVLISP